MSGAAEPQGEMVEDAEIEGLRRGTWFGGFLRGVTFGGLGAAVALVALSLSQPLPDYLPGVGSVEVVTAPTDSTVEPAAPEVVRQPSVEVAPEAMPAPEPPVPASLQPTAETAEAEAPAPAPVPVPEMPVEGVVKELAETDPPITGEATEPQITGEATDPQITGDATVQDTVPQATAIADQAAEVALKAEPAAGTDAGTDAGAELELAAVPDPVAPAPAITASDPLALPAADPAAGIPDAETAAAVATDSAAPPAPADGAETPAPEIAALTPPDAVIPEISLPGPAFEVNARDFQAPVGAPLMAIVLEDPGASGIAANAISLMTMPLTFAVRPDRDGARALSEAALSAGHEVLMSLPLLALDGNPESPTPFSDAVTPEDLANQTRRYLSGMNLAMGVTAPEAASVLTDQRRLTAILAPLEAHGFAYLDLRTGIGSPARRIADAAGLPYTATDRYAPVGATEAQIYQMLDGASFLARRQGTSVLAVPASPDALKAVVRWGLERGGQEVWFAPLSAVIARRAAE